MRELRKVYGIWRRELIRFTREKSRIASSLAAPLLWLIVLGGGLRMAQVPAGENYQSFLYPGIIGMAILFTSVFSGISVIWDREFGFLKEVLVAPVARWSIVLGKAMGGATAALIQALILLPLAPLVGVELSPVRLPLLIILMAVIAVGLTSTGLLIASLMGSMEGFNLIMGFAIQPMFFLSGAIFPLGGAPEWLRAVSYLNPFTYGVDVLRWVVFSEFTTLIAVEAELAIVSVFAVAMVLACSYTFSRKK
ncbi:MAG: ABC transporter permease [Dehalococcoidia bacterium]|nr:ABC transporter permease [Dehalococcoidia bacterium]